MTRILRIAGRNDEKSLFLRFFRYPFTSSRKEADATRETSGMSGPTSGTSVGSWKVTMARTSPCCRTIVTSRRDGSSAAADSAAWRPSPAAAPDAAAARAASRAAWVTATWRAATTATCTTPSNSSAMSGSNSASSTVACPDWLVWRPVGRLGSAHRLDEVGEDGVEERRHLAAGRPREQREGDGGHAQQHEGVLGGGLAPLFDRADERQTEHWFSLQ